MGNPEIKPSNKTKEEKVEGLSDLEQYGSSPLAKSPTDPDCAPESAKSVSTSRTAHMRETG